jgi:hypothetical protein
MLEPTAGPSPDDVVHRPASPGAVEPYRPRMVIHVDMDAF